MTKIVLKAPLNNKQPNWTVPDKSHKTSLLLLFYFFFWGGISLILCSLLWPLEYCSA